MSETIAFENIIIPKEDIDGIWDKVKHEIVRTNGEFLDENDVKSFLKEGNHVLWIVKEENSEDIVGVITLEFAFYPRHKIGRVVTCAGRRLHEWINKTVYELEQWAIKEGCSHMDMFARKGWKKILTEYNEDCVLLRKKL